MCDYAYRPAPRRSTAAVKRLVRRRHPTARCTTISGRWCGGDGTRLRALMRLVCGAPIPKQYCRLVGGRSLLESTLARVRRIVPAERTLVVVNQDHLPVAGTQLATIAPLGNTASPRRNRPRVRADATMAHRLRRSPPASCARPGSTGNRIHPLASEVP
jgi:hypothetical protein